MSRRKSIEIDGVSHGNNPIPLGCRIDRFFISGGISGHDPMGGTMPDSLNEQCANMFRNVRLALEAAGGSPDDVLSMRVYVTDRAARPAINKEWLEMFPDPQARPARHTLKIDLPEGMLVNCEIFAVIA